MLRIEATEPPPWVGPCMTAASSSTTPSSLGRPPKPTEWSLGSASTIATPSIAASSGSCPFLTSSIAFSTARRPLPLATTIGFFVPAGLTGAAPIASVLRLAAAVVPMKRRRFTVRCMNVLPFAFIEMVVEANTEQRFASSWSSAFRCVS